MTDCPEMEILDAENSRGSETMPWPIELASTLHASTTVSKQREAVHVRLAVVYGAESDSAIPVGLAFIGQRGRVGWAQRQLMPHRSCPSAVPASNHP